MSEQKTYFIGMTGAGAEVAHAPFFADMDTLKDWLYAYAKFHHERENGGTFESAYEVETEADRWPAAAEWAFFTGRGEWFIGHKAMASIGPNGEPLSPDVEDFIGLDQEYLDTLSPETPAP